MITTITVFEGGRISLGADAASDEARARLLATCVGERPAFSVRRGHVFAGEFAGAIDVGRIRVEVLPKPFGVESVSEARCLLFDLLHWAGGDARVGWFPGGGDAKFADLLEVVQREAVRDLLHKLEQGPPRRYQPVEEVSSVIRGRILFSAYARQLPSQAHVVPVRFAPLTVENPLGTLLKALATFLWHRSGSYVVRKDLARCLEFLDGVPEVPLTRELVEQVRLGRAELDWHRQLDLARVLTSGHAPDPTQIGGTLQPTLLFPLNRLFELAVRRILSQLTPAPLSCATSPGMYRLLTLAHTGAEALAIRPDLLFRNGSTVVAVGDAKWKALVAKGPRHGIAPGDLYQLLAYMRRLGTLRGLLFYPRASWMPSDWSLVLHAGLDREERITVLAVDVSALVARDKGVRLPAQTHFANRVKEELL